jgi:hypothetical protein
VSAVAFLASLVAAVILALLAFRDPKLGEHLVRENGTVEWLQVAFMAAAGALAARRARRPGAAASRSRSRSPSWRRWR